MTAAYAVTAVATLAVIGHSWWLMRANEARSANLTPRPGASPVILTGASPVILTDEAQ